MERKIAPSGTTICGRTYDAYIEMVKTFHGHVAPGVVIGGFMVDLAYRNRPPGEFLDAMCETRKCLPDAVQLLTPCTIGNGWLKIVDLGRFAFSLYDKNSGNGVRVYASSKKLIDWPELKTFFFKLKPKHEQNSDELMREIALANTSIFDVQQILVKPDYLESHRRGALAVCPACGEGYPVADGEVCLGCQGKAPYSQVRDLKGK